jgi:hypothetical protein
MSKPILRLGSNLNRFLVGSNDEKIVILNLPITSRRGGEGMPEFPVPAPLSVHEAVTLAAWLVAFAGERQPGARAAFVELLDDIERTTSRVRNAP